MKRKVSSAGADVARVTWNVISRVCRHWHARLLVHANRFWHQHQHHTEEVRWGGSPNLALSSILMFLVDLDIHQIAGYHYFVHHLPSRGAPTTPPSTIMMTLAHQIANPFWHHRRHHELLHQWHQHVHHIGKPVASKPISISKSFVRRFENWSFMSQGITGKKLLWPGMPRGLVGGSAWDGPCSRSAKEIWGEYLWKKSFGTFA